MALDSPSMTGIGKLSSARRCGASEAMEPVVMPISTSIMSAVTSALSRGKNSQGDRPQIEAFTSSARAYQLPAAAGSRASGGVRR